MQPGKVKLIFMFLKQVQCSIRLQDLEWHDIIGQQQEMHTSLSANTLRGMARDSRDT